MITEPEWIINEKMLPARSEQNHCNFVFFSNRIDIAKLDDKDRRYCVVWTPPALPEEVYREVSEEIANGGVAALHDHLLHLDLSGFSPHTKPPLTQAKRDLIELGMDSTERFWRDWSEGRIDPALRCACLSSDLYDLYRAWAQREGLPKPAQKQTLLTGIGKKPGVRKADERYQYSSGLAKRGTVVCLPGADPAPGVSRKDWLGQQIGQFKSALNDYRNGNGGPGDAF
jgi:putative DNA primase/helicase